MLFANSALAVAVATAAAVSHVAAACQAINSVMTIVLENQDTSTILADSYMGSTLVKKGYLLNNFYGVTHPSQPNYIAMISGSRNLCLLDFDCKIGANSIVDLLEQKGKTWKSYQESYPGNCFTGTSSGTYRRKHNPFMSFDNIRGNPTRCANIVNSDQLSRDAAAGKLPNYIFYTPDMNNDGHDTSASYASNWLKTFLEPKLVDPAYANVLFHVVFDESETYFGPNHIYSILLGKGIKGVGLVDNAHYDHYSFLATLEGIFDLGNLGKHDKDAVRIPLSC
ncbi:hypothetical protein CcCBS67573_g10056 [Chytriomyces confervae]|uniref:Acid phosphatase n=1 Tax=Chytriomyces confervae TaxID=246404 RepID=A0A507DHE7_9FUNG|nr:hypothetical protein CcCBS67573_g10056 [Chytriomyces confervae]